MNLTSKQELAFNKYINKENIFITGPGGSGKSAIIKLIVKHAKDQAIKFQVCGLTGCCSILLEGCMAKTLHSWGGIGLAKGDIEIISHRIATNKFKRKNWKKVDLLIVDEVSMMSEKLLNLLDLTAKKCRGNNLPFGGIQLIFSGDFFQLPPVGDDSEPETVNFCFESSLFNTLFPIENIINFDKIFRQKDPIYSKILNQIRVGKISNKTISILNSCVNKKIPMDQTIKPTIILPLKYMVDQINNKELANINEPSFIFNLKCNKNTIDENQEKLISKLSGFQIENEYNYLISNLNVENKIELKKGAQVMCVINKNMEDNDLKICNGSQGIIVDFCPNTNFPIVKFYNGTIQTINPHSWESEQYPGLSIQQIPLILSWAITIHKSQGASIEFAEIDIGEKVFAAGQTYVALSRVTSLEGLFLRNFDYSKIKVNGKVEQFYENLNSIRS